MLELEFEFLILVMDVLLPEFILKFIKENRTERICGFYKKVPEVKKNFMKKIKILKKQF